MHGFSVPSNQRGTASCVQSARNKSDTACANSTSSPMKVFAPNAPGGLAPIAESQSSCRRALMRCMFLRQTLEGGHEINVLVPSRVQREVSPMRNVSSNEHCP